MYAAKQLQLFLQHMYFAFLGNSRYSKVLILIYRIFITLIICSLDNLYFFNYFFCLLCEAPSIAEILDLFNDINLFNLSISNLNLSGSANSNPSNIANSNPNPSSLSHSTNNNFNNQPNFNPDPNNGPFYLEGFDYNCYDDGNMQNNNIKQAKQRSEEFEDIGDGYVADVEDNSDASVSSRISEKQQNSAVQSRRK